MTVTAILCMIRDLPRDGRYPTLLAWRRKQAKADEGPEVEAEQDPGELERLEMRQWATPGAELAAGQLNVLNDILRFTPQWKKTPPEAAVVGPVEWWPEEQLKKRNKKLQKKTEAHNAKSPSVGDVMAAFGYTGG